MAVQMRIHFTGKQLLPYRKASPSGAKLAGFVFWLELCTAKVYSSRTKLNNISLFPCKILKLYDSMCDSENL